MSNTLLLIAATLLTFYVVNKINYHKLKRIDDIGENKVKEVLSHLDESYIIKNNVHLSGQQIDHLVIKGHLIYVIETKHYSGTLHGNASDTYLKHNQTMLYNPIKQNNRHCDVVRLRYPNYYIVSIICFTSYCKIDIKGKPNCIILTDNTLLDYINRTSI